MNTAVNSAMLTAAQVVRKLGAIETRMALFHTNLNGATQGTQAISFQATVTGAQFIHAVKTLFDHYVALQCVIKKNGDALWFHRSAKFDDVAVRHLHVESTANVNAIISECLDHTIDAERALWRAQLVTLGDSDNHVFLFSAHHAIIDANGMHDVANNFFRILSALLARAPIPALAPVEFPHAVDDLLQATPAAITPPALTTRGYDEQCPIDFRRTGWQFITLEAKQFAALNVALQRDNIKLHSLISAALCQAMHAQGVVADNFNFGTAVSLRFLQDSNPEYQNPLGCYMSIAFNPLQVDDDLASFARKYDRELMQKIFTGCLNKVETHLTDFEAATHKIAALDHFSQGAGITNMGHVGIAERYTGIEVTDYLMLANRVSANFSIVAHCYDFRGKQYIGLVYPRPCLADDVVANVAADLQQRLHAYSQ